MARRCLCIIVCTIATMAAAEENLPQRDNGDEGLEIDPPLLIINNKPIAPIPTADSPGRNPEQLQLALNRAKKNAASAEHLYKAGIIAKVQIEERAMKVVRLERDLAEARLQSAKEELAGREQRFSAGELAKADLDEAASAFNRDAEAARVAAANLERAEVEAARHNVERQQKLLALGSGRQADVNRAEAKLSALTQPEKN